MVRLASSVTRNISLRSFTCTSLPSPRWQWQMLEPHHTHAGTLAHRRHLKLTLNLTLWDVDNHTIPDNDYQSCTVFVRPSKASSPQLGGESIPFFTGAGDHHSETKRECQPIPARTLNQTMILRSQHTLFAYLYCFQPSTHNWHSHWARYQQAWSHLEAMALGKEASKRKCKTLQDQAWRESRACVPNREVCTYPGITARLVFTHWDRAHDAQEEHGCTFSRGWSNLNFLTSSP